MIHRLCLVLYLFIASTACAQVSQTDKVMGGTYALDKTHASITWKVMHLGLSNYTARFTDFDATLRVNGDDITQSQLEVTVNPLSVETDYPNPEQEDFNKKLALGKEWFNAGKYPTISFVSTSIEKTSNTTATLHGDLTFLGVTKPLSLNVTYNGYYQSKPFTDKPALGFSAAGTLKRSDWGMNTNMPFIGDEVALLIEAEFNFVK